MARPSAAALRRLQALEAPTTRGGVMIVPRGTKDRWLELALAQQAELMRRTADDRGAAGQLDNALPDPMDVTHHYRPPRDKR